MRLSRFVIGAAFLCVAVVPLGGSAHATDLTGSWTTDLDACDKVFARDGNNVSFRQDSDMYGSGFIIEGWQIRSPTARCRVTRRIEDNDVMHMIASCATDIMYQNMQFSVKILGDGKVSRIFPGVEGMELTYYRCPSQPK